MQEAPEPHFKPPAKDQVTSASGLVTLQLIFSLAFGMPSLRSPPVLAEQEMV